MPRKFNVAVSGGRDDFAHTHINDIGLQPCAHATTGAMGFNVVLGGYMSPKRVAESIDMDLWVPDDVDVVVELTTAILRIFRDEGGRKDRQKARLMWLVETYGAVQDVAAHPGEAAHPRCDPSYKARILAEMASYVRRFWARCLDEQISPLLRLRPLEYSATHALVCPTLHGTGPRPREAVRAAAAAALFRAAWGTRARE